eukprot:gene19528-biopygen17138
MAERASESEMQILSALWDESPQSATDLAENVGAANGWTLATVKTLVARLVQKGAVTAEAQGRRFLYSPAVERADAVGDESQRFVDRLAHRLAVVQGRIGILEDILQRPTAVAQGCTRKATEVDAVEQHTSAACLFQPDN